MNFDFELKIQDGDDTLVQLQAALPIDFRGSALLNLDPEQVAQFSRWVQGTIQPLLTAGKIASDGNIYRIVLDPSLQKRIADGTAIFRNQNGNLTGTVISNLPGAKGQMLGFAELKLDQIAQLANVAAVAWQIAAMMTAQHFLAEIDHELKEINRKLDDLLEFLETQAAGRIVGRLKALHRSTQLMQRRALDKEEQGVLKHDILRLIQEAEAQAAQYVLPFSPIQASLENAKDFNPQEVQLAVQKYAKHLSTAIYAVRAYVTALSVAPHAGWARDRLDIHLESADELLAFLASSVEDFDKGMDSLEERGKKKDPRWRLHPLAESALNLIPTGRIITMLTSTWTVTQELQTANREKQRTEIMTAKRPLIATQQLSLADLQNSIQNIRQQADEAERRSKAPQILLAELDNAGVVKQLSTVEQPAARAAQVGLTKPN